MGSELSAEAIRAGLSTQFIGQAIYYWPAIGSTNDELKRLADAGAPEGTLAITDEQLAGRGRLKRSWIAPAGSSLLMSLLFRPTFLPPTQVQRLTMICSLAAADAVAQTTGLQPALKWPNDLLLDGKKLAGVLTELGLETESATSNDLDSSSTLHASGTLLAWAVVGIGLNVNVDFTSPALRLAWPALADTAISLAMLLGRPVSRLQVLQSYMANVEARYAALTAGDSPHQEWAARLTTLGKQVTVRAPEAVYQGVAEGVDETGALLLRQSNQQVKRILTGDVEEVRQWNNGA